jgi:hypothetical protein
MNPTLATTILLAGAATAAAPQSPPPAFEVASIKRNSSGDTLRAPSLILPGGRFTATNNTLSNRLKTVPVKLSLDLNQLAPGRYTCQVTVLDPKTKKAAFWHAPVVLVP